MSPKYKSSERLIAKEAQVSYDFRVSVLDVHKHADRVRFFHGLAKPYFAVSDCCILRSEGHVTFACIEFRREQEDNDLDEDTPPKSNKGISLFSPSILYATHVIRYLWLRVSNVKRQVEAIRSCE